MRKTPCSLHCASSPILITRNVCHKNGITRSLARQFSPWFLSRPSHPPPPLKPVPSPRGRNARESVFREAGPHALLCLSQNQYTQKSRKSPLCVLRVQSGLCLVKIVSSVYPVSCPVISMAAAVFILRCSNGVLAGSSWRLNSFQFGPLSRRNCAPQGFSEVPYKYRSGSVGSFRKPIYKRPFISWNPPVTYLHWQPG